MFKSLQTAAVDNSFFFREFQSMTSAPDDSSYHQTKTLIGF